MNIKYLPALLIILLSALTSAQPYPDQHYVLRIDSLYAAIETNSNIQLSSEGKSIQLVEGATDGYIILKPQYSQFPFNEGLPSWNGNSASQYSSFKIQMRFPYNGSWSPWLTVGFWNKHIWGSYGTTSYNDGKIDIDYVKLYSYQSGWQFKVILTRTSSSQPSPTLKKLSFFVSDSRTTASLNYTQILNDKPAAVFIPTTFVYQYGVDPEIGGSICSPTSVSMILKSYNKTVDTYQFALKTLDPYWNIFGVWPRVVQNASEFGLDGAVTRYRSWSQAREVLANGGRIAMSVSQPLYSGHLIMLAGINSSGNPIVHDPAKSNGYSYVFNKSDLSHSWFDKGGIAYTFYPEDETVDAEDFDPSIPGEFVLYQNYPNPFNPSTTIMFTLKESAHVRLTVLDLLGQEITTLIDEEKSAGTFTTDFNASSLSSGIYFYHLQAGDFSEVKKMQLIK